MFARKATTQERRLRRQPKLRRVENSSILSMPRLEIPRTARRRRRRNRVLVRMPTEALKHLILTSRWISLFLLVLSVGALVLIGMDESFYLTTIPVEGVASIPPEEIVGASELGGAHIFAVNPGDAAEQIAAIPGVISATVTLEWPNSAHISIGEDTPIAVWEQGGEQYWINSEGQLVPARIDVPGLLHIRSEMEGPAQPSTAKMASTEEDVEDAEDEELVESAPGIHVPPDVLQGALQLRELRPNIEALSYSPSGGLSYQDGRGWRVYFGSGTDMAQKLVVYESIVEHLLERGVSPAYISVSNQENPYYLGQGS